MPPSLRCFFFKSEIHFLIYINDLPLALDYSHVDMYADDTSIYYSSKSISSINNAVNKDLQSLKSWLDENKLSLNVAKTQSILIGSRYKIRAVEQPDNQPPSYARFLAAPPEE